MKQLAFFKGCRIHHRVLRLEGRRFGRLTVVEFAGTYDKAYGEKKIGFAKWKCTCDCGRESIVVSGDLTSGSTRSCGCLRKEISRRGLKYGQAAMRTVIKAYRQGAKKKGLKFELSESECEIIFSQRCHYCGASPSNRVDPKLNILNGEFVYNGIDRKDNAKGYCVENVLPCCFQCNRAKGQMGYEKFIDWIFRCSSHLSQIDLAVAGHGEALGNRCEPTSPPISHRRALCV